MEKQYFLNNVRDISKILWVLLFTTLTLNIYLVQRSFEWNSNAYDKIENFEIDPDQPNVLLEDIIQDSLMQQQGKRLGLKVNYGTLTLIWPLIILGLYLSMKILLNKKYENIKKLSLEHTNFDISLLALTGNSLFLNKKSHTKLLFFSLFIIFPSIGIGFHAYSGYFMIDLINEVIQNMLENGFGPSDEIIKESIIPDLKLIFVFQMLIALISQAFIYMLNFKSIKIINNLTSLIFEPER